MLSFVERFVFKKIFLIPRDLIAMAGIADVFGLDRIIFHEKDDAQHEFRPTAFYACAIITSVICLFI